MKKLLAIITVATIVALFQACGDTKPAAGEDKKESSKEGFDSKEFFDKENSDNKEEGEEAAKDDEKGIGKFTNVEVGATLDKVMAESGLKVYDLKCSACHRLTSEKLVGPGWKGVTERRKAEWVMNFSTNPDEMLDKDAIAKGMLEECLVRMPNQGLSDDDARAVYEFMRKNDGVK